MKISDFAQSCLIKGGFAANIPNNIGKTQKIGPIDLFLHYDTTDFTFNAAFFTENDLHNTRSLIEEAERFFNTQQVPFSLITSEQHSSPATIEIIKSAGFYPAVVLSCMAIQVNPTHFANPDRVDSLKIDLSRDRSLLISLYTNGYPIPAKDAELMVNTLEQLDFETYVAWLNAEPVAVGSLCFMVNENERVGYLGGAATLKKARGNGMYGALLRRRLKRSFELQCSVVIVQANVKTSMSQCKKLGFQELDRITFYTK